MNKYINVITTCQSKEEAKKIVDILLERRLISCAQISSVESSYYWQGKIEHANEYHVQMKTKQALYKEIEKVIKENHSYKVPEIFAYDIKYASKDYLNWIDTETINEVKTI